MPAADEGRLAMMVEETVAFHTLHYLEAQGQGSSFTPRLIGFARERDRADRERANAEQSVNDQVDALASEILTRLLPEEPEPKQAAQAAS